MAKKTRVEPEKDKVLDNLSKIKGIPLIDGAYEVGGRRVVEQDGSVSAPSKSTLRKELSDKLTPKSKYYPAYMYALNGGSVDPNYEIPRVNFCNQVLEEVKAHIPYQILNPQELDIALRITPRLFSPNAVGIWSELGWAEKEYLVEQKFPLALQAAMTRYVANPAKYAEEKRKEIESLQADKSKHVVELKDLQCRLMDYFEPSLLADVVDKVMNPKPKKAYK